MSEPGARSAACKACGIGVRLAPGELERIVAEYFRGGEPELVGTEEQERRLALCGACTDLLYGSTCRHCGCLVEVRARLAGYACPAPEPKW